MMTVETATSDAPMAGIHERQEYGLTILSSGRSGGRRVLFVNSYGGLEVWQKVKRSQLPPHHLWGCLELVRRGYEVGLAESLRHFEWRRPLPHDLGLLQQARAWLRPDDILYCGHTLLFWTPLLAAFLPKCHLVSVTYAREELDFARRHRGIIALTPAAADQARKMAPRAKVAHLSWGCDLDFFPRLPYDPRWFLSCGITQRDFHTVCGASARVTSAIRLICPGIGHDLPWPSNVTVIDGGSGWNYQKTAVSYSELFHEHYAGAIASLIILKNDPKEYTAVGFTNLLEAMTMARPAIVSRTGAIPGEIDVEKAGCGLHVPPDSPGALADAIRQLEGHPEQARAMGERGRQLAEKHYNIERYAAQLHNFFEQL